MYGKQQSWEKLKTSAEAGKWLFLVEVFSFWENTQRPSVARSCRRFWNFSQTSFSVAGRILPKNGEGFHKAGFQLNSHLLSGQQS